MWEKIFITVTTEECVEEREYEKTSTGLDSHVLFVEARWRMYEMGEQLLAAWTGKTKCHTALVPTTKTEKKQAMKTI